MRTESMIMSPTKVAFFIRMSGLSDYGLRNRMVRTTGWVRRAIICSSVALLQACAGRTIPVEGLTVFADGAQFKVQGRISGDVLHSALTADQAIQFAIDRMPGSGGEVVLESGEYRCTGALRLRDHVTLRGSGRGTVVRMQAASGDSAVILLQGIDGATVTDLTVLANPAGNAQTGILLNDAGDCRIRNCVVFGFPGYGIRMCNNSFLNDIAGCSLIDNGQSAVYFQNLGRNGRGGEYVPNVISNCVIYGGNFGIECSRTIVLNITDCVFYQTKSPAVYLHNTSNAVMISGCRTFQIETDAIVVDNSHEINISGNMISWHRGDGIILRDVAWGSVTANNIIDTGVRDTVRHDGVVLTGDTRGLQVTGNSIYNWGDQLPLQHGVYEASTCRNNIILGNNINFSVADGVVSHGRGSVVANNLSSEEAAYIGMDRKPYPDFTRTALDGVLQEMRERYMQ